MLQVEARPWAFATGKVHVAVMVLLAVSSRRASVDRCCCFQVDTAVTRLTRVAERNADQAQLTADVKRLQEALAADEASASSVSSESDLQQEPSASLVAAAAVAVQHGLGVRIETKQIADRREISIAPESADGKLELERISTFLHSWPRDSLSSIARATEIKKDHGVLCISVAGCRGSLHELLGKTKFTVILLSFRCLVFILAWSCVAADRSRSSRVSVMCCAQMAAQQRPISRPRHLPQRVVLLGCRQFGPSRVHVQARPVHGCCAYQRLRRA